MNGPHDMRDDLLVTHGAGPVAAFQAVIVTLLEQRSEDIERLVARGVDPVRALHAADLAVCDWLCRFVGEPHAEMVVIAVAVGTVARERAQAAR